VDRFVTTLLGHLREETTFLQLEAKRARMERNIRNIFTRHDLSHKEVQTLYGVIEALRRGGRRKD
jgi:tRNA C32,U32 (ribose-2'-O)-methylase TrmJ